MMQITYQKRDGTTIKRLRNTMLPYSVGDTTSMGWKVISIEYEYKNKYYPEYEYRNLIYQSKKKLIRRRQIEERIMEKTKSLLYNFIMILILYYIKIRMGL